MSVSSSRTTTTTPRQQRTSHTPPVTLTPSSSSGKKKEMTPIKSTADTVARLTQRTDQSPTPVPPTARHSSTKEKEIIPTDTARQRTNETPPVPSTLFSGIGQPKDEITQLLKPTDNPKLASTSILPAVHAPITPKAEAGAIRKLFEVSASRKERNRDTETKEEETYPYFGSLVPNQPRTTALLIFSFLSNADTYNAAQVCKDWNHLANDEELWLFP